MIEIDCRKCENLKPNKNGCKKYGDNAGKAVEKCAKSGFSDFKVKSDIR